MVGFLGNRVQGFRGTDQRFDKGSAIRAGEGLQHFSTRAWISKLAIACDMVDDINPALP